MDDFETFKASREKMDPTSRKMSEHQWKQAYAAYRSARERVSGGSSEGKGKKRRHAKTSAPARGAHAPSSVSELGLIRRAVRDQSAYADLRLIIDILAWIAIAVVALAGVLTLLYYTSVAASVVSILGALAQVIGIVVGRLLVQVLIDIPDIALYRSLQESAAHREATLDPEP